MTVWLCDTCASLPDPLVGGWTGESVTADDPERVADPEWAGSLFCEGCDETDVDVCNYRWLGE